MYNIRMAMSQNRSPPLISFSWDNYSHNVKYEYAAAYNCVCHMNKCRRKDWFRLATLSNKLMDRISKVISVTMGPASVWISCFQGLTSEHGMISAWVLKTWNKKGYVGSLFVESCLGRRPSWSTSCCDLWLARKGRWWSWKFRCSSNDFRQRLWHHGRR